MRDLKDNLKSNGYSHEEAYFHRLNRKLIERIKRTFSRQKKNQNQRQSPEASTDESVSQELKKAA